MASDTISILDGSTFVVSDRRGDIAATPDAVQGLFYRDTRFLSRWCLTVDGRQLEVLSTENLRYFEAQFFLYPPTGTIYENPYLSVIRKRKVGDGFHEDVTILNHAARPIEVELRIDADADFADLFEVKDALAKKGERYRKAEGDVLVLGYRREDFVRETWISPGQPAEIAEGALVFRVAIPPHASWNTCIDVCPATGAGSAPMTVKYGHDAELARPNMRQTLAEWLASAPTLETSSDALHHTYERSLVDLAALRFYSVLYPDLSLPAAGLPWFMTVFGRDSLITSYQALPFVPELARSTLLVLAARQGREVDDFRDEEPGKILHEIRFGELVHFRERPHAPYFGAHDATPLFLVLLDEYVTWTGDLQLAAELEPHARAALRWIDEHGDRDHDGYIEYQRRNEQTGLENQCWKDSWNSIISNDGSLPPFPRATCELQGYVYDAKRRCARLARDVWQDPDLAEQLEREAADLRERFNRDFWMDERGFFAVALDGDKRRVDTLTSNVGHLLWSGIVDDDKAARVAELLMGEAMFSGWGVRTMAVGEGPYNPIEYHNGTVWPHDNSLIAAGLARYGYRNQAAQIARAMLDAAALFDYRLPEVFAGYPRETTRFPVEYPTACSPQAWATGAPLLFLRTLLGLHVADGRLVADPVLPDGIDMIELNNVRGAWGRTDVRATRQPASADGAP